MNDNSNTLKCLLIRVLVSPKIGLGHVTRCRGVATVMAGKDWSIVWVLSEEESVYFDQLALPGSLVVVPDSLDFACEAPFWSGLLTQTHEIKVVLLDGYLFDETYLCSLYKLNAALVVFDDFMLKGLPGADILINSSILAREADYSQSFVKKLLLGPRFAPVRLEFMNQEKRPLGERAHLLVMFGGSDILDLTEQFISALTKMQWPQDIPVLLVTGAAYPNVKEVKDCLAYTKLPITYQHNVENMAEVMSNSRVALSAAGSTLFELTVMGVPTISVIVADNQEQMAWEMHRRQWCVTYDARESLNWQNVLERCISLWAETSCRVTSSDVSGDGWCDGLGLSRIAEAIEELL